MHKKLSMKASEDEFIEETIKEIDTIKSFKFKVTSIENNAVIINLFGWSKRVYFDMSFENVERLIDEKSKYKNKLIEIFYIGDIKDPFKIRIFPIKGLDQFQF